MVPQICSHPNPGNWRICHVTGQCGIKVAHRIKIANQLTLG